MAHKRVLVICGDFMEDAEVMVPIQALQAYGVFVDAVSPGKKAGDFCRTSVHQNSGHQNFYERLGHNFKLNATFDEIDANCYDGLLMPGGRAPEYLCNNPSVVELVTKFAIAGKPIASVCHAGLTLAAAGVAEGRKCTGFPTIRPVLIAAGAHWIEPDEALKRTVVDGNLITAVAYPGNPEFIRHFVKALGGKITGSSSKRILFLCGDFVEDYEVTVPFQSLKALGCLVDAVCPNKKAGDFCLTAIHDFEGDQSYSLKPGYDFPLTAKFDEVSASSYDALVVPGGRSAEYLALEESVLNLIRHFMECNKPIAAISQGPQILAAADVLKGKKCTAYPEAKLNVTIAGATWLEPDPIDLCFTDGNLVTGAAWPGHPDFISKLMSLLGIQVTF
ncbi:hypothetical protein L6164_023817 [Bauhinia variegata]|uniref:Uncharacterized protein n=1 Tax=Bauhinia variegata TaxID=167791 RepID=A0ACB9MLL5_BAUVA|nr:hypothetical protein L6164_023817 [Bauhinia variegata]